MLHFEERVARLWEYLRCEHRYDSKYLARPFIAEFAGFPSSGKTTCITEGDFTNHKTIAKLANRYQKAYEELKGQHPQLHLIDTTEISEEATVNLIAEKTLSAFEKRHLTVSGFFLQNFLNLFPIISSGVNFKMRLGNRLPKLFQFQILRVTGVASVIFTRG
jgi:hypothetical protein